MLECNCDYVLHRNKQNSSSAISPASKWSLRGREECCWRINECSPEWSILQWGETANCATPRLTNLMTTSADIQNVKPYWNELSIHSQHLLELSSLTKLAMITLTSFEPVLTQIVSPTICSSQEDLECKLIMAPPQVLSHNVVFGVETL